MFRTQGSIKEILVVNSKEVSTGGNGVTVRCFGSVHLSNYINILI
jgi:hypothetical protein